MESRKKILLTGGTGTIGRMLHIHLGPYFDVHAPTSRQLDLSDRDSVTSFFQGEDSYFDIVIHCAVKGANDVRCNDYIIAQQNLLMYFNLSTMSNHFGKLINIASGCELGYDIPDHVSHVSISEDSLYRSVPTYPYGLSKNIIARDVLTHKNWFNLRLWGIKAETRIFKKLWDYYENGDKEFIIDQDKYQDYISEQQFVNVVKYFICNDNTSLPNDVNVVPFYKKKVSDVVREYIEEFALDMEVRVTGESPYSYYGNGLLLQGLNIL